MAKEQTHESYSAEDLALLEPLALKVMQGLLEQHFARRRPGRPRKGSEMPRLMRGFRSMVRASQTPLDKRQQELLLNHLINHSLF